MTPNQWMLILFLGLAAYGIRILGLLGGQAIRNNARLRPLLEDLPGCLVVGLIAASLANQPLTTWVAAGIAVLVAVWSNNVVVTMVFGFMAILGLRYFGL
ncbi:MAG: branched-subunit amino acid transport protein [Paracoccaceae bacterium]|jgi:branched-subunit amino acid transport protein